MTTARAGGFAILVWVATLVSACASEAKDDLSLATTTTDRVTTTERPTTTTEAPTTTTVLPVEPQTFDGAGPAVLDVDKPIDPMLAYVKANDAGATAGLKPLVRPATKSPSSSTPPTPTRA
jgi:hypothetical protein